MNFEHHGPLHAALVTPAVVLIAAAVTCLAAGALQAWPGHDWEQWRAVSTWRPPDLRTSQAGRHDLAPLLAPFGEQREAIDGIKAWEERRAGYADTIRQVLGTPGELKPPPSEVEVLGEEIFDDHIRRHIRIRSEPDDWIPAYLFLPKPQPAIPLPAMICVHQTVAQGKDEPAGIRGDRELAFALELVRRGFICLAPDMIGFGERIPAGELPYAGSLAFYKRHPAWSCMGKMVWDVGRVVDYLETLESVDRLQIGCIGHSHGAYTSLFAGALEPRISLVIASCGFNTFRADPTPNRWSHLTPLIPQIGLYLPEARNIPFDWQQVLSLVAPRPLYIWYATQDPIFPDTLGLEAVFKDVAKVYGLYGAADDVVGQRFDGPHGFPAAAREQAYRWLSERFFPVGNLHQEPATAHDWPRRRELIRKVIRRTIGPPATQPAAEMKVLGSEQLPAYERRLIEYSVAPGERIRAYLCVPRQRPMPRPAVLVLHETDPEGKREAAGLAGPSTLAFAAALAERGFVTLAADSITAGERIDRFGSFDTRGHYLQCPNISAMGRMLGDAQRGTDVLAATEGVDPRRIAAIGHSLGAELAVMLAAFDERIQAVVASCGYATFEAERDRLRWARDAWFSYMPKLRPVFQRGQVPHWDWDHVLALIAPRPLLQLTAEHDQIFPESMSAHAAAEEVRRYWVAAGAADRLENLVTPGKHEVRPVDLERIARFLDRHLGSPQAR